MVCSSEETVSHGLYGTMGLGPPVAADNIGPVSSYRITMDFAEKNLKAHERNYFRCQYMAKFLIISCVETSRP